MPEETPQRDLEDAEEKVGVGVPDLDAHLLGMHVLDERFLRHGQVELESLDELLLIRLPEQTLSRNEHLKLFFERVLLYLGNVGLHDPEVIEIQLKI